MVKFDRHRWDWAWWAEHTWIMQFDLGYVVLVFSLNLHYCAVGFGWRSDCVAFYFGPFALTVYFGQ